MENNEHKIAIEMYKKEINQSHEEIIRLTKELEELKELTEQKEEVLKILENRYSLNG